MEGEKAKIAILDFRVSCGGAPLVVPAQLAPMRLTLIALSACCVDALLAASISMKASSHSCEAARRTGIGRRTAQAATRPRAAIICRDGFFDSVPKLVHCHLVHSIYAWQPFWIKRCMGQSLTASLHCSLWPSQRSRALEMNVQRTCVCA